MKRFLIWGAGGHGKVVADLVRAAGHEVCGYIDADANRLNTTAEPGGAPVTVLEDQFMAVVASRTLPAGAEAVALAVGDNQRRLWCLEQLGDIPTPPLVHPAAIVSPSATIGRATVVFAGSVINAAARIDAAAIVNTAAVIEHDCRVGQGAHVSPGAILAGGVSIGERSWVGAGATIIQNISIGGDVVVGAGAVVIRDVPDGVTVVGVPAAPLPAARA